MVQDPMNHGRVFDDAISRRRPLQRAHARRSKPKRRCISCPQSRFDGLPGAGLPAVADNRARNDIRAGLPGTRVWLGQPNRDRGPRRRRGDRTRPAARDRGRVRQRRARAVPAIVHRAGPRLRHATPAPRGPALTRRRCRPARAPLPPSDPARARPRPPRRGARAAGRSGARSCPAGAPSPRRSEPSLREKAARLCRPPHTGRPRRTVHRYFQVQARPEALNDRHRPLGAQQRRAGQGHRAADGTCEGRHNVERLHAGRR